ncbi:MULTISPECIES: HNH endonuclease signature motif containing protein [unclassified Halomonas]|uniref:HNH endonuclease n=1 Tax=unclassified Halomonas TaxID=2609666 RepID=UPI002887A7DF|nr:MULTISPECIES: HNH endonuclease signature motif containing protein [unclassified Halomonas]MDT0501408.1 HNH endonuclease signature motif containing protein [Halomonas sp. PAR7]MDT0512918.1 HNH endonuclease signature motif containing protein [Halomonas sp. LES1]MDT0591257.1 HNH endonuclease signature motif containing protein [Halomonas sp. PAR8]
MPNIDTRIRHAAFKRLQDISQEYSNDAPWEAISQPVPLDRESFLIASRAIGIFKPKQMPDGILSIKTVVPKQGRINIYSDGTSDEGGFWYSLEAGGSEKPANRQLLISYERRDPIIYLVGVAPGRYLPLWPCYIDNIDLTKELCHVSMHQSASQISHVSESSSTYTADELEKRYVIREAKTRVHQAEFRARVMRAYSNRCAMTGLPVPQLLDAAHIIPDSDQASTAEVSNGISLSRLHHRAYDADLIGIDPNFRIHLNSDLLSTQDGPLLESMKQLNGQMISMPKHCKDRPSQEALELRFQRFLSR